MVNNFYMTVRVRGHVEVERTLSAQRIVRRKPRQGKNLTPPLFTGLHAPQNILGLSGTAYGYQNISTFAKHLNRLFKHMPITEIIANTREKGSVIERNGPHTPSLPEVRCLMAGNSGARAIAYEHDLVPRRCLGLDQPGRLLYACYGS
jgi:hypothetical protein